MQSPAGSSVTLARLDTKTVGTLRIDTESVRFLGPVPLVHTTQGGCFNSRTAHQAQPPAEAESQGRDIFRPEMSPSLSRLTIIEVDSARMPTAELYVVIYTPLEHSMSHWVIYLRTIPKDVDPDDNDRCEHLIYQATGPKNSLESIVSAVNPRHSRQFREVILVSSIDTARDIEETKTKLKEHPMSNDVASWNCQDWGR